MDNPTCSKSHARYTTGFWTPCVTLHKCTKSSLRMRMKNQRCFNCNLSIQTRLWCLERAHTRSLNIWAGLTNMMFAILNRETIRMLHPSRGGWIGNSSSHCSSQASITDCAKNMTASTDPISGSEHDSDDRISNGFRWYDIAQPCTDAKLMGSPTMKKNIPPVLLPSQISTVMYM